MAPPAIARVRARARKRKRSRFEVSAYLTLGRRVPGEVEYRLAGPVASKGPGSVAFPAGLSSLRWTGRSVVPEVDRGKDGFGTG